MNYELTYDVKSRALLWDGSPVAILLPGAASKGWGDQLVNRHNLHEQLIEAIKVAKDCLEDGNEMDGEAGDAIREVLSDVESPPKEWVQP